MENVEDCADWDSQTWLCIRVTRKRKMTGICPMNGIQVFREEEPRSEEGPCANRSAYEEQQFPKWHPDQQQQITWGSLSEWYPVTVFSPVANPEVSDTD